MFSGDPTEDAIVHINKLDSNTDCEKCIYCNGKGWRKKPTVFEYLKKLVFVPFFEKCKGCRGFGYV